MGLHTGVGELDADGAYVGHDVHRAARIGAAGNGGQVLLSEATAALVDGRLPPGLTLRPLGAHRLKDLRPERIAQLAIDGLPADFPPIRSLDARPNNLPTELTSFVGPRAGARGGARPAGDDPAADPHRAGRHRQDAPRAAGRGERRRRVPRRGLVRAARRHRRDPALVVPAIAPRDGHRRRPVPQPDRRARRRARAEAGAARPRQPRAGPRRGRRRRRAAAARRRRSGSSRRAARRCGSPASRSTRCPGSPRPSTSTGSGRYERERLPAALRAHDPESLLAFESVRLFVARGRRGASRASRVTDANAADVAAIVAHLGRRAAGHRARRGAAPVPHAGRDPRAARGPARPARRRRGRRPGAPAVAARRDHVEPRAARRARRAACSSAWPCSSGGFDLARAEAVAGRRGRLGVDVLDGLASLVDQSLVRSGEVDGEPRFSMLEPIREYALERLEAARRRRRGEGAPRPRLPRARRRSSRRSSSGDGQRVALDQLEREHANVRAAIDWADARGDAELALGLTVAVWRFWQKRGYLREARTLVTALIGRPWFAAAPAPDCAPGRTRCWAGSSTGTARSTGPGPTTRPPSRSGARSATGARSPTPPTTSRSCSRWACSASCRPTPGSSADALLDEALDIYRSLGDDPGEANVVLGNRHPALLRERQRRRGARRSTRVARAVPQGGRPDAGGLVAAPARL